MLLLFTTGRGRDHNRWHRRDSTDLCGHLTYTLYPPLRHIRPGWGLLHTQYRLPHSIFGSTFLTRRNGNFPSHALLQKILKNYLFCLLPHHHPRHVNSRYPRLSMVNTRRNRGRVFRSRSRRPRSRHRWHCPMGHCSLNRVPPFCLRNFDHI